MSLSSKLHVYYCFETLSNYLNHYGNKSYYSDSDLIKNLPLDYSIKSEFPNDSYPLFVTWNLIDPHSSEEEELRGCIGNFSPLSLHDGLKEYALISALQDTRFDPIDTEELDQLSCCVSLLVKFELAEHYLDWEIGVHGIRLKLNINDRIYGATYLPEVAAEQGWTKEETIKSLLRKGGYKGKTDKEVLDKIKITRYQSHKSKASFKEYLDYVNKLTKN
ncbi:DUF51 family protein [Neoconidiobolus thromboides FSU 785]|nr:DUF51 family protein [Neoconidiobolus thromboides FSU 785]